MAECARVAEVNAFIRLGGRPVLWKGTVFWYDTIRWVVVRHFVGAWDALPFADGRVVDGRWQASVMVRSRYTVGFTPDDTYSWGKSVVVEDVPPYAPPVGEWG